MVGSKKPEPDGIDREGLLRCARRIARDEAEAEDLVHEALTRAIADPNFHIISNPRAWAIKVMTREAINRWRRERRLVYGEEPEQKPAPEAEDIPDGPDISDAEVHAAIDKLKPIFSVVVRLFYFERKKQKQISETLGISEKTVSTRLHRARAGLQEILLGKKRRS